ncbi:MAG TPA: hypothetical protein VKG84_13350 [Candidatus Acidoferrales bacterium]|nr:hypothetical protein [Candidatus Acidoferrales bacterium]
MIRRPARPAQTLLAGVATWLLLSAAVPLPVRADDKTLWAPVPNVLFTIDSKPAKLWTIYHASKDKKEHRLLLQIGARYLMIDTQLRMIVEYDSAAFSKKGTDCEMPRDAKGLKALPSEDWVLRDTGTSYLVHAKLKDEGRLLEIQLPKMPDFRNVLW